LVDESIKQILRNNMNGYNAAASSWVQVCDATTPQ